jgi:hypothetical protein
MISRWMPDPQSARDGGWRGNGSSEGKNLSTRGRIQPERFLDLANPLTPQVIQIQQRHSRAAIGRQSFHFVAFESEVYGPPLSERMKQGHLLACQRISARYLVSFMQIASGARQGFPK